MNSASDVRNSWLKDLQAGHFLVVSQELLFANYYAPFFNDHGIDITAMPEGNTYVLTLADKENAHDSSKA